MTTTSATLIRLLVSMFSTSELVVLMSATLGASLISVTVTEMSCTSVSEPESVTVTCTS